jgi:pyruvate dehydrogenase E1 component alpha subunit
MNMAALWKLPVVYIIENNRYGMGTSVERSTADHRLLQHGRRSAFPGEAVDGMDVVAVRTAGEKAVEHARSGRAVHPRDADLSLSRPFDERPGQVPDQGRGRQVPQRARSDRPCPQADARRQDDRRGALKAIDAEIRKIVNDAAEFAQHSPEPDPSELWTDVLVGA